MATENGKVSNGREYRYHVFRREYLSQKGESKKGLEEKIEELYDDWDTYEEDVLNVDYKGPQKGAALFAEVCPDRKISVLDCGAGSGLSGQGLYDEGFKNLHALDISQNILDIAKKRGIYKTLVCSEAGNASKLPYEDDKFDALYSVGCVGPFSMRMVAMKEWVRIVKPGGVIMIIGRHKYWQPNDGKQETEFREEFKTVVEELEKAKKVEMIAKKVIPDYIESTEGIGFAYKVL